LMSLFQIHSVWCHSFNSTPFDLTLSTPLRLDVTLSSPLHCRLIDSTCFPSAFRTRRPRPRPRVGGATAAPNECDERRHRSGPALAPALAPGTQRVGRAAGRPARQRQQQQRQQRFRGRSGSCQPVARGPSRAWGSQFRSVSRLPLSQSLRFAAAVAVA
jgi:hypothetical protein